MPIRINLLAEDQANEEERRKDPVKRAYLAAGLVLFAILLWSGVLQFKVMADKSELGTFTAQWQAIEPKYKAVVKNQLAVMDAESKLASLQTMTTNRFLWGSTLNAFQKTVLGVDDIQVTHLRCEQLYLETPGTPAQTNNGVMVPARAGFATENATLYVDAMDSSAEPGGNVNLFKQAIAKVPYFQGSLDQTNAVLLTSLSPPQVTPNGRQPYVTFTLQCSFPEKVR